MIEHEQQKEDIKSWLKDRRKRLNNLYWVIDEQGQRVRFKLNWFQEILFRTLWYLSIVLKARQVGITTFVCILYLDDCLFMRNVKAAVIADTREHASKIFDAKVKYAFDNLPDWVRTLHTVDADSSNMLKFSNGSSIEVATSVRSGTYQRLLITEFGKICAKHPEKAREIVTGALNAIHAGQMVIIESTAEGAFGYFYEYCQKARALEAAGAELSLLDYKFFFFPWWRVPHYRLTGRFTMPREMTDYFNSVELKLSISLDQEQRNWYFKKAEQQQENMKREFPSFPDEAFEAAIEGAYYAKQIDRMRHEKRITRVPFDPLLSVQTWWDLGMNDTMFVIFTQQFGNQIRIIDTLQGSGEGLLHYVTELRKRRDDLHYNYELHNFPFDIEVKELGTGKSRKETLQTLGVTNIRVLPKLGIQEGIEQARVIFSRVWIDEVNCAPLIKGLSYYRHDWDDKLGVWKSEPRHDEFSHPADAFRYLAVGLIEGFAAESGLVEPQGGGMSDRERFGVVGSV